MVVDKYVAVVAVAELPVQVVALDALPVQVAALLAVAELPEQAAAVVALAALPVQVAALLAVAELPVQVLELAALPVQVPALVAVVDVAALPLILIAYKLLVAASTHELPFHFCHLAEAEEKRIVLVATFVGDVVAGSRANAKSVNLALTSVTRFVSVLRSVGLLKSAIINYLLLSKKQYQTV